MGEHIAMFKINLNVHVDVIFNLIIFVEKNILCTFLASIKFLI